MCRCMLVKVAAQFTFLLTCMLISTHWSILWIVQILCCIDAQGKNKQTNKKQNKPKFIKEPHLSFLTCVCCEENTVISTVLFCVCSACIMSGILSALYKHLHTLSFAVKWM